MKRFITLMVALGFCAAYGLGCTKMASKSEEPAAPETPAVEEMTPPPPPPAAPAEEAAPAAPAEGSGE